MPNKNLRCFGRRSSLSRKLGIRPHSRRFQMGIHMFHHLEGPTGAYTGYILLPRVQNTPSSLNSKTDRLFHYSTFLKDRRILCLFGQEGGCIQCSWWLRWYRWRSWHHRGSSSQPHGCTCLLDILTCRSCLHTCRSLLHMHRIPYCLGLDLSSLHMLGRRSVPKS